MSPETLTARADGLLRRARGLLDELPPAEDRESALRGVTATVLVRLEADGRGAGELTRLGVDAQDLLVELRRDATSHRLDLQARVSDGLSRLRGVTSSQELLDRVCDEVIASCGFRRAVLSRIHDGVWYPWMARFDGDPIAEGAFTELIRGTTISIAAAPVERQVLEEHRPRIVRDVPPGRGYGPMVVASQSTSYVVAPINPAGRVVGFLHADHHPDTRVVDEGDRDVLWAFAEGFGRIYERTELLERLRAQRSRVHETFDVIETITSAIDATDIELTRRAETRLTPEEPAQRGAVARAAVDELLTEREREVLSFMVRGLGNGAIAEALVIKEGTVKSHVKHILRKLGAVNRAAVIALSLAPVENDE